MEKTKMQLTSETVTDFWNDSCNLEELTEAVQQGAVGATSNPVIVYTVLKQEVKIFLNTLDELIEKNKEDSEDEIAWKLIREIGVKAAKILEPVFKKNNGLKGRLSLQVNPKYYRNKAKMVEHAKELSQIAPNMAIKAPATEVGIEAFEEMTACGITVNCTVCFTVPQAIACAEAIEKGLKQAGKKGIDTGKMTPYVTIMVGRLDDHLKRIMDKDRIVIDPGYLEWAGIAVFKKAYKIFQKRGYKSTLLTAAYRNHMQWSELIGGKVVLTIPYKWWNEFNTSDIEVCSRIDNPVNPQIVDELYGKFADFKKAYDEDGMKGQEFVHYGATIHTLNQFVVEYGHLLEFVRERMLR